MRKLLLLIVLLWSSAALAQTTTVTATITDSDGTAWANGTYSISFIAPPGNNSPPIYNGAPMTQAQKGPYTGTLNGSGTLSVSLPDNVFISPAGSVWKFVICPNASAACSQINQAVTGGSQNFTPQFSALVTAPRFAATPNSYGYNTTEITVTPVPGGSFYNVTLACPYIWSGSAWACGGGGANAPGTSGPIPEFASYTFYINSGTVYARNNSTGAIDFSGTDASVVVQNAINNISTICGTLYFKNGIYNFNSLSTENGTGFTGIHYAVGFPGLPTGTNQYCQWIVVGESSPALLDDLAASTVQTGGVIFNVTPTAVASVASNVKIVLLWARPDATNVIGPSVYMSNLGLRFPDNQRGCETASDMSQALNVGYKNVLADFNIAEASLAFPVAGTCTGSIGQSGGLVGMTTTNTEKEENDIDTSYCEGYDQCWDIRAENTVVKNSYALHCNFGYELGVNDPGGALVVYHPITFLTAGTSECARSLTLGQYMQNGSQVDMIGWHIEDATASLAPAFQPVYHAIETNAGFTHGLIDYTLVVGGKGNAGLSGLFTLFDGGNGGGFTVLQPGGSALLHAPGSDTFSRQTGNTVDLGPNWLPATFACCINSVLNITSNSAQITGTGAKSGASVYSFQQLPGNDQFSGFKIATIDANSGTLAEALTNVQTTNLAVGTFYAFYCGNTAAGGSGILKRVAGVATTLSSQTSVADCPAGTIIELQSITGPDATVWLYALKFGASGWQIDPNFPNPAHDTSAVITGGLPGILLAEDVAGVLSATLFAGGNFPTVTGLDSIYSLRHYAPAYSTLGNCAVNSASPAACGSSAAGVVVIPTTTTTYTVNTTVITSNSRIFLQPVNDNTGIPSSPTCTTLAVTSVLMPASRVAGTSFTFNIPSTVGASCVEYWIVN